MKKQTIGVIICAGGKGLRAGFPCNKLLVPLDGEPVLKRTISAFDFPLIDQIVVASSQEDFDEIVALCKPFKRTVVAFGGITRSQSVSNALRSISTDIVLIHDGARPFVSREIIEGCIQSVLTYGSGICAVDCTDTVAAVEEGKIFEVAPRDGLRQIQTPQGFFTENILAAYERAAERGQRNFTDDSSVFLEYCGLPHICKGSTENKKLTYPSDFTQNTHRCGFGVDTHAFGKEQDYILLAGVKIPSASGLIAHSDGDVLAHAVMDALLSAAGMRDIGFHFPDSDEKWKNADSMKMLENVVAMLDEKGFAVGNLSVAVQAEKPRLAGYIDQMKNALAGVLKIDPSRVGVSAGTNEGLGYVGEGKGITVNAYALIKEK